MSRKKALPNSIPFSSDDATTMPLQVKEQMILYLDESPKEGITAPLLQDAVHATLA